MMLFRRILRYIFAFNLSKRLFNALLPRFMRRKIASSLDLDTGPFNRPIDDLELIPIQPDSYLAVYFKRYGTDIGPGVSLYVFENEILRFDCFGGDHGHYHSLPCLSTFPGNERNDFSTDSIEAQIDQALAEITGNYIAHLARHFRRRIREFRFDQAQLGVAVSAARSRMLIAELSSNE
ncbi:MAG: hypothetical protein IIA11_04460 [Proteobacteria bacterium]|nr:hypothetical protein [Pseudomonadota bacterium]